MSETRNKVLQYKEIIYKLYSVEGRSLNYIATLLDLRRQTMTTVIKDEWWFKQANVKRPTPRIQKLLNRHKEAIITYCSNLENRWLVELYETLGITENELNTLRKNDETLDEVVTSFTQRKTDADLFREERLEKEAQYLVDINSIEGEVWKDILGYEGIYQVSNFARIKSNTKILTPEYNKQQGRYHIQLCKKGVRKSYKRYRLVALTFLDNPENLKTVNHKDGNCCNDHLGNLEWSSQEYQNWHKLEILKRDKSIAYKKNGKFKKVIIDGKFTFKTLKAAARFLGVSDSQIQRYLSGETPFDRKIELEY
ncbi:HNH endonuclease [Vibrio phage F99]